MSDQLAAALRDYTQQSDQTNAWDQLLVARRNASQAVVLLSRKESQSALVQEVRQLIRDMQAAGVYDRATAAEDRSRATELVGRGWSGLIAAMVLTPAWGLRTTLRLQEVPDWLAEDYARWIYAVPNFLSQTGEVNRYAEHIQTHLDDLAGWVQRSPGSQAVSAAAKVFLACDHARLLTASDLDLRAFAAARGRVAQRYWGLRQDERLAEPMPREGRRLRLGVVAQHFGVSAEMRLLLPLIAQLDDTRFEVNIYAAQEVPVENMLPISEQKLARVLPESLDEQVALLRAEDLDVLVFGTNLSRHGSAVARLALRRMAPLQVGLPLADFSTGLSTVDLFVTGEGAIGSQDEGQFSERLGVWPGPAMAISRDHGRQNAGQSWTKASLDIPEDATVFVSEAPYECVTPEVAEVWANVLAQVPGSQLILHSFGASAVTEQSAMRFSAMLQAALQRAGVDQNRLLLSTLELSNPGDVQALLKVGDVYLETFAANKPEGMWRALEVGLPVIVREGCTWRSKLGATWLRALGLNQLIATDSASYAATAVRLATDRQARMELSAQIQNHVAHLPIFADDLAMSDGLGALLEAAFDRLVLEGAKAFAADRSVLRPVVLEPTDQAGRWRLGKQMAAEGRTGRAVEYFMCAIGQANAGAELWLDAARALRADGKSQDAIQALETSLRLDPKLVDGWKLLAELADQAMIYDLAAEARQVVDTLLGQAAAAPKPAFTQPKVESIVGKLRSLRVARKGIV